MSAAATAAGYLYAHGQLPLPELEAQVGAERSHRAPKPGSSRRLEPKSVSTQAQSAAPRQMRAAKIEYRKRRFYALPSAA